MGHPDDCGVRRARGASALPPSPRQTETRASGHGSDVTAGTRGAGGDTGPPNLRCSEVGFSPSFHRSASIAPAGRHGLLAVSSAQRGGNGVSLASVKPSALCPGEGQGRGQGVKSCFREELCHALSRESDLGAATAPASASRRLGEFVVGSRVTSEPQFLTHKPLRAAPQLRQGGGRTASCPDSWHLSAGRAGLGMGLGRCSGPRGPLSSVRIAVL